MAVGAVFTTKCVFRRFTACLQVNSYQWRYVAFLKPWIVNTDIRIDRLAGRLEGNIGKYGEGGSWMARRRYKGSGSVWQFSADSLQKIWVCVSTAGLNLMLINKFKRPTATSSNQIRWYSQGSYSQHASFHWSLLVVESDIISGLDLWISLDFSSHCVIYFPLTTSVFVFAYFLQCLGRCMAQTVKADSHIACRFHAAPAPFPCHAMPLRV